MKDKIIHSYINYKSIINNISVNSGATYKRMRQYNNGKTIPDLIYTTIHIVDSDSLLQIRKHKQVKTHIVTL